MSIFHTMVGEHVFQVSCESILLMKFLKRNFSSCISTTPHIRIEIHDHYGIPFTNFEVEIDCRNNKICYQRADYLIEVDQTFCHAIVSVHDDFALKHALMNLYSAFIVHHNWGLLIHSSCVIENDQAHIFSGQSGAGKSTVARLSAPRKLLSDEASIIKIASQEITVFNSPFRSEIETPSLEEPMPLASIQLLKQALQNKRVRLKKSDALIHMIDKVFYWKHYSDEAVRIMDLLYKLIDNVPVYELYFQKNNRFWELIS